MIASTIHALTAECASIPVFLVTFAIALEQVMTAIPAKMTSTNVRRTTAVVAAPPIQRVQITQAAPTCTDINECNTNNGGCGSATYTTCTNNPGAAPTCTDINECNTNNGGCGSATYTTCTNNPGAAPTCTDINECNSNNGGCGSATYTTCTNNPGAAPTCVLI